MGVRTYLKAVGPEHWAERAQQAEGGWGWAEGRAARSCRRPLHL